MTKRFSAEKSSFWPLVAHLVGVIDEVSHNKVSQRYLPAQDISVMEILVYLPQKKFYSEDDGCYLIKDSKY